MNNLIKNKIHNSLFIIPDFVFFVAKRLRKQEVPLWYNSAKSSGFGLLEVVVAATIISISLFSLIIVLKSSLVIVNESTQDVQASFLLEEGLEAVRIIRDSGWDSDFAVIATGTPYYLEFDGATWRATSTNIFIDGVFERSFVVYDVYRDVNDDMASAGTFDANTKKVTAFVAWSTRSGTSTKNISTYLANIFGN